MEILTTCKMQIALFGKKLCNKYFDRMFILAEIAVFLDGVTAYTVNHRDSVPEPVNFVAHALYLVFLQLFICELFSTGWI